MEGLYAQLVGQGARCVVAARWPIADVEAAELAAEFVRRYVDRVEQQGTAREFSRARALNQARIALLDHADASRRITFQAAAFDIYGLG